MLELIQKAESLCQLLEDQANIELNINIDIGILLEKMSWEVYKLSNDLRSIKEFKGV